MYFGYLDEQVSRGMRYGAVLLHHEVRRSINKSELWAFHMALRHLEGTDVADWVAAIRQQLRIMEDSVTQVRVKFVKAHTTKKENDTTKQPKTLRLEMTVPMHQQIGELKKMVQDKGFTRQSSVLRVSISLWKNNKCCRIEME